MQIIDWAASVKPDLVRLQQNEGIPALFAAAQMCHESCNPVTGGLTKLAAKHHNYGGMKWVGGWQEEFGAYPVMYGTWEVIDGRPRDVDAAFAGFPDWQTWLRAYARLLSFERYRGAKPYSADPLLYAYHVWKGGWATDPQYLVKLAEWMVRLWPHYGDTISRSAVRGPEVRITDPAGHLLATGWLEGDQTLVKARELAESLGLRVEWRPTREVILHFPGLKAN